MKPQDFADFYAVKIARHEGRPAPRNPENFQTRFTRDREAVQEQFDALVANRQYIETHTNSLWYSRRIFRPVDLGKMVVSHARPHLFAQLSFEETRSSRDLRKVSRIQRVIRVYPETEDTELTDDGWSFVRPRTNNVNFIGSIAIDEIHSRAIPSNVATLNEFKDTLGHVIEAQKLEVPGLLEAYS